MPDWHHFCLRDGTRSRMSRNGLLEVAENGIAAWDGSDQALHELADEMQDRIMDAPLPWSMYTFDLLCFAFSLILYTAYNLYINFRETTDPAYTIHGVSKTVRTRWVSVIVRDHNGILAVQTLRNATMADQLGQFVLLAACRHRAAWKERVPQSLVMAVNITPAQLRNPNFAKMVLRILHDYGLTPTQLELEITESSILEPDTRTLDLLTRLRVLGVRLAIDDFGMASIHAPARGATHNSII